MPETNNLETALKNEITIEHGGETYVFKVPSIKDRIDIAATGADLRKKADPERNGITLGYDPGAVLFTDTIATFMVLLKSTSAKWVYAGDTSNNPKVDLDKWPDNVPVMEVVNQFNEELEKFRK
jgi:hypothetical protein